ncbi:MAG: hypothetical protein OXP09_01775 [Gammaproteobacteria bacterium]|nr:hypothetical protein [Gammaproteobacteria bacterium]
MHIGKALATLTFAAIPLAAAAQPASTPPIAPLLDGIGPLHFPISTVEPRAQRYFNQALTLAFGFNHAEAVRSFRAAAALDPTCGICYAGQALALGPNINMPMSEDAIAPAWKAVESALAQRHHETDPERDYIDAIAARYSEDGKDRQALDAAFSEAMAALAAKYPDDLHARTLYAESLMDRLPWAYWNDDGTPKEMTPTLVEALERVLAADPQHPGAAHLYIHAMEQFTPKKAEAAADRLGDLVPVAGHLVHMPSHIYLRLGRYHDAVIANERAAAADEDYIAQCNAQGLYPAAYYPHNLHFLWYAAMMEGRRGLALATAARLRERVPVQVAREMGAIQAYLPVRIFTFARFGMWDEALAEPPEAEGLPYATAMWHYGRGLAFAARGDVDSAHGELAALQAAQDSDKFDLVVLRRRAEISRKLVDISANLVRAGIEKHLGNTGREVELLREAVDIQLKLPYSEPPFWHFPVRQALGTALLRQGDAEAARAVFEADLAEFPENGWSLHGLRAALAGSGRSTGGVERRLEAAWQYSDIEPGTAW